MNTKANQSIPDAPEVRQAAADPSEGESPAALFTKAAGQEQQGEVPVVNAAPTQVQQGVSAASLAPSEETQAALAARSTTPMSEAATRAVRDSVRQEQKAASDATNAALEQAQAEEAARAIVPSGLDMNRPLSKAVVVDTGSTTANALSTSTLRQINGQGQRQATNVAAASGVNASGNIVRANPRLVAAQAAQAAAKAEGAKLKEDLEVILKDVPFAYRSDVIRLEQYCVTMAPGRPLSDVQGAAEQVALFRLLQNVINRQTAYFTPLFTAILRVFRANVTGALGDAYRNRFNHHIPLSGQERKALQKITHLLSVMADPNSRKLAGSVIDIEAALEDGLTEEGRNRVISYFG